MSKRMGKYRGRKLGLVAAIAAIACLGVASVAVANNLDRRTATNYAKSIARDECQQDDRAAGSTSFVACTGSAGTRRSARSRSPASVRGSSFVCTRQLVIKLESLHR